MNALRLFRRGPGRRRLPDAYEAERARADSLAGQLNALADRAALVEVHCLLADASHPAWWTAETPGDCPWCLAQTFAAEAAELRRILENLEVPVDDSGSAPVPALADDPESWINLPFPPVAAMRIIGIPPGPVDSEAADVSARTQQTDVRDLRKALAVMDAGPVRVTWGAGGLSTRPPLPDETPTERLSAVTAVMPVWDRSIPVELSKAIGSRARDKVRAALTP